jgi:hypothetical protein
MFNKTLILRAAMFVLGISAVLPVVSALNAQPASGYIVAYDMQGSPWCDEGNAPDCEIW